MSIDAKLAKLEKHFYEVMNDPMAGFIPPPIQQEKLKAIARQMDKLDALKTKENQ